VTGAVTVLRFLGLRHFRRRKLRTLLTAGGIAAGVALVFSISVINGTLLSSARESVRAQAGAAQIEVASADTTGLPSSAVGVVEKTPGVERAIPVMRVTTKLTGASGARRVLLLGVTPAFTDLFPSKEVAGSVHLRGGVGAGDGLVLAAQLARGIGAGRGSKIAAEAPSGPRLLTVTGTVSGGALSLLNGGDVGVMYLPAAQSAFERPNRVDSIYVITSGAEDLGALARELDRRLGGAAIVGPPGERGRGFDETFGALSTLTSLAGLVALFVAMFVVYNSMSMALAERRREISLAQTFGATTKEVATAFLAEAVVLGVVSSTVGLALGGILAAVLVGPAVAQYSILPLTSVGGITVTGGEVAIALSGGVLVAVLGALLPALRVLRVAPVESLRPEASYEWERERAGDGGSRRRGIAAAASLVAALSLLALFAHSPERKPLAVAGLLAGLSGITLLLPSAVPVALKLIRPVTQRVLGTVGRIANDALIKNPARTTYTVGALVLTLGMVVSVGAALGSYEHQIQTQADETFAAPLYVGSDSFTGLGSDQPLPGHLRKVIESVPGVASAYPQRYVSVDIDGSQALLYAVPTLAAERAGATERFAGAGEDERTLIRGLLRGGIVISRLTAKVHDLAAGDRLRIPTPTGARAFRVAGVFPDLASFDSMYIDYGTYRRLWKDSQVDRFAVLLAPGASQSGTAAAIGRAVSSSGSPGEVLTRARLVDRILGAIRGLFSIARGIQLAALVIAVITIANTMFTQVLERRWETGLSRALGMSARQSRAGVLIEAGTIGSIGGAGAALLGTVLGFVMTRIMEVQFSWSIAFRMPWALLALSFGAGVACSVAAGALPSRLSTRVPIVEALHYE
jgi:putative ABC transport system permease protein